jgi:hypothetical protein
VNARPKRSRTHEHEGHLSRGLPEQQDEPALEGLVCDVRRGTARERRGRARRLESLDESHQDAIVYEGGPLGPTKRTSRDGVADIVNELTVFVVVRASSHEEAAKMFEGHPHLTIFPCDAVDVMPLLSGPDA